MSAPEHPDWLEQQVKHDFSWNDEHCSFDDGELIDALGDDGLAALGLTTSTVYDQSNYDLHELIESYERDHLDDDEDTDEDDNPTPGAVLLDKVKAARNSLCPRDYSCECTQDANDDFKSHMDELLTYFANNHDIVAIGKDAEHEVRVDWDVPDWRELERLGAGREWDAMRVRIDYTAGTAEVAWGQYGGYNTLHLTRLRGEATELWSNWSDNNSEHNRFEDDPAWTIATMTAANVTMLLGLTHGAVDISAHATLDEYETTPSVRRLWETACALKLNEAPDHVQRLIGTVGSTWRSTLDELILTVNTAAAHTEAA